MDRTVSFAELLAAIVRKWKGVCVTILVFALLLGGFQAYRQVSQARAPENSPEQIEERYQTALEEYNRQQEDLQEALDAAEKSLASKEEYLENSILMQIDPYNTYVANIVFTFSNIDDSEQLYRYPNTAADYLPTKIRSQYIELWKSMDVSADLGISKYADVEWKYLAELITVSALEGEMVSIQAVAASPYDAEQLADAVYDYFEQNRELIGAGSAEHQFTLVNRTVKDVIDDEIRTGRENLNTELDNLRQEITDTEQALKELEAPKREAGYSVAAIAKSVFIFVILGAVVGFFLASVVICCWWIFANRVSSSYQLEQVLRAPFLGSVCRKKNSADTFADVLLGERRWKNRNQALIYVEAQIKALRPCDRTVLLISTLPEETVRAEIDEVIAMAAKSNLQVSVASDVIHNAEAVAEMQRCTSVLFIEKPGCSRIPQIENVTDRLANGPKEILGFVTA